MINGGYKPPCNWGTTLWASKYAFIYSQSEKATFQQLALKEKTNVQGLVNLPFQGFAT
jgi:hypothetical protein